MKFEDFVAAQGQPLLRLAYVLTSDAHHAEDLTQTTLAKAHRNWRKVAAASNPDAYVRRILVNAHLDWCRRRSSTERPVEAIPEPRTWVPDPADEVSARDHMRGLLSQLAPRARAVLVLRYYADLNDEAIADLMGITSSSVRATASRALATLRAAEVVSIEESR